MSTNGVFGYSVSVYKRLNSAVGEYASANSSCLSESREVLYADERCATTGDSAVVSEVTEGSRVGSRVAVSRSSSSLRMYSGRRVRDTRSCLVMGTLSATGDVVSVDGVSGTVCRARVGGGGLELAASMAARRGLVLNMSTTTWLRDCRCATAGVAWEMGRKMPVEK